MAVKQIFSTNAYLDYSVRTLNVGMLDIPIGMGSD